MRGPRPERGPRVSWLVVASVVVTASALESSRAEATRDVLDLMTMDHVVLEADWVGLVRAGPIDPPTEEEEPTYGLRLHVLETWWTRWSAATEHSFRVAPEAVLVEPQREYVVFLTGGEYRAAPFTYREHSVFDVERDGRVRCDRSTFFLFGLASSGALCMPQEMVDGEPITVAQMEAQFHVRRARAAARLPDLDARPARALGTRPTPGSRARRRSGSSSPRL